MYYKCTFQVLCMADLFGICRSSWWRGLHLISHLNSFQPAFPRFVLPPSKNMLLWYLQWDFSTVLKGYIYVPLSIFLPLCIDFDSLVVWLAALMVTVSVLYVRVYSEHICSATLYEATSGHTADNQC